MILLTPSLKFKADIPLFPLQPCTLAESFQGGGDGANTSQEKGKFWSLAQGTFELY